MFQRSESAVSRMTSTQFVFSGFQSLVGRCNGNFVRLIAFQPIKIQRGSQHCQAVPSLVEIIAERRNLRSNKDPIFRDSIHMNQMVALFLDPYTFLTKDNPAQ